MGRIFRSCSIVLVLCCLLSVCQAATHRLIFMHHSCGENWLNDGLRQALTDKGIEVHDATYGDAIAEDTDVCHWYPKFRDNLKLIFTFDKHENIYYSDESQNDIIMFKSCFPNSDITDDGDPKVATPQDCEKTIASYQATYNSLVTIFAAHPDKLFIIVTAPPLLKSETSSDNAGRARRFNAWLKTEYLAEYKSKTKLNNVVVFDFFDILADEKGFLRKNLASASGDSHPNSDGNNKATQLFLPFLDSNLKQWKAQ